MRQIGSVANEILAERFVDYLTTKQIAAQCEEDGERWLIWVKDENDLGSAREALEQFTADPEADPYLQAGREAYAIRTEAAQKRIEATKNFHQAKDTWNAPLSRRAPTVFALIVICIALAVAGGGGVFSGTTSVDRLLMFDAYFETGRDPFTSIRGGQVWRVVTPALLHGDLLHLVFNMYWMYFLGTQIESKLGRRRFLGLTLAGAALPNLLQAALVGANFLGISGVVFAYFGYILLRRSDGYFISQITVYILLAVLCLGFLPISVFGAGVAQWAHAGGFATGAFLGYLPDWRKAQRRRG